MPLRSSMLKSKEKMDEKIKIIKNHISLNETGKALAELKQISIQKWETEALLIESRHHKINEQIRLNIVSFQEANIEQAKINSAILEICREIEAAETNNNSIIPSKVYKPTETILKKGDVYSNYRIIEHIGGGGFGDVYRAEHTYLSRLVALKIAHEFEDANGVIKHLIDYTLSTLSKLTHPNIVQVVDAGFSEGRYFIASNYVEGINLREYLEKQILDSISAFQNRLILFDKICKGVEFCHNTPQFIHGFRQPHTFHGDIKPENIIIRASDNEPIITDFMMLDFDKVHQINSIKPMNKYSDNLTAAYGTPKYMAREQGIEGIITEQTEVYSLGILLAELLDFPNNYTTMDKNIIDIVVKATASNPKDRFKNVKGLREILKKKTFILILFCTLISHSLISQVEKDSIYWQKKNAPGVKMINIVGTDSVWTQKIGHGERSILLLHGGPGATHEYFENFPVYLDTNQYTIYFYDQLGSYFSDNPNLKNLWELDRVVDEIETVRKALQISELYLLGHSWGGVLAIHYAIKYPEHLKGLILSNSPSTFFGAFKYREGIFEETNKDLKIELGRKPKADELNKRYEKIYRYGSDSIPEVFKRLEKHYNRDPKRWKTKFSKQKEWGLLDMAKQIKVQTLIIGGEKDFIDPNDFQLIHKAINKSELLILPDAPHFPMWSHSESYFKTIDQFIMALEK